MVKSQHKEFLKVYKQDRLTEELNTYFAFLTA